MSIAKTAKKGVTFHNPLKADDGYTLFSGMYGHDVWLVDINGQIVNRWSMPYIPGCHQILLPNGNLLFAGKFKSAEELGLPIPFTGIGGILMEVDWTGNLVWQAEVPYQSHDFHVLNNGHIIYPAWIPEGILPDEIAMQVKGGCPGTEFNGKIWGDVLLEIDRKGNTVWKWVAYEHLDPEIDTLCPLEHRSIWPYINAVWVSRDGNILLSSRFLSQVTKIEYPTGKVLARYGRNRINYQHDCRELANGNILVFDNGAFRHGYEPSYSRVVEIDPSTDEIVWEYKADPPSLLFTGVCGGSERLENGNTVICDTWHGRILEVTSEGDLAWEYISPFTYLYSPLQRNANMMWRAHRYPRNYPGFEGKDLNPSRFPWENRMFGPDAHRKDFTPSIF